MSSNPIDMLKKKGNYQLLTAVAFLHHEGKIFAAKRAVTKKFFPGRWELPGGHIDFGEAPEQALKREIMEEFGVNVKVHDPFFVFTYMMDEYRHQIEVVYFCTISDDEIDKIKLDPEQHSQCVWLDANEDFVAKMDKDDEEIQAVRKGFAILQGRNLETG